MMRQKKDMNSQSAHGRLFEFLYRKKTYLTILSCMVVFITSYLLILPAITLDEDEALKQGGIDVPVQTEQAEQDEVLQTDQEEDLQADTEQRQEEDVQKLSGSISFAGKGYEVTVDCDGAEIPEDAELKVRELEEDSDEYTRHLKDSAEKLDIDEETIPFARFFDIAFVKDGEEIEPESGVLVRIELKDVPEESEQQLKVVHFENDGPVIMDSSNSVEKKTGTTEMEFETESFSVYGVITVPSAQQDPAVNDLDGKSFTISHDSRYVTTSVTPIENNNNTNGFGKASSASGAATWFFERPDGSSGNTYYIYDGGWPEEVYESDQKQQ